MTKKYRSLSEVEEEYYRAHPEEIDGYIETCFEEYAEDSNTGALLSSLRVIARVKGVSAIAETAGLSRKGLQKALSDRGNPRFKNMNAIIHAMGYRLVPQHLDSHTN